MVTKPREHCCQTTMAAHHGIASELSYRSPSVLRDRSAVPGGRWVSFKTEPLMLHLLADHKRRA